MIGMILNELYLCFNKKSFNVLALTGINILIQLYIVYTNQKIEVIKASSIDGILKALGGIERNFSLFPLINWIILIGLLLLITQSSTSIMHGFDIMLLMRSNSKTKWWLCKVISLIVIDCIYALLIIIATKTLSILFFYSSNQWSKYNSIYYPHIYRCNITPNQMEIIIALTLITGFFAITTLFQSISLIFNNNSKFLIVLITLSIMLCIFYTHRCIPRVISPINYPSVLDLNPSKKIYLSSILFNSTLTLFNILVGIITINKKDYSILDN